MATDLEKLVVQLSADFKSFEREMAKANGVSNKQFSAIERRARQMNKNLDGIFASSFKGLAAPLAGIGAALGFRELQKLADTWTDMKSRVDIAAGSMEKGTEVMGRLQEMARRTYSGLEQTADSYLLNARTLTELGYSTKTQLDYTEALNNALVISGAKGDRAASVMGALSKAMALGKLSGDNLNTVISTGGRVAEALAASMGVTTLELRKLGSDGKIGRKELVGITKELEKLRKEADGMQATVGDATQLLKDALLAYVGAGDQAVGISARLAEAIILVADNFKVVGDAAVQLAFVVTSALIGRALAGVVAMVPTTVTAITVLTTAMRAGTLTAGGFAAAMGPIGLAAGALVATLYLLSTRQNEAEKAAELHAAAVQELSAEINNVDYANREAVESTRAKVASDIKAAEVALERAMAEQSLANALQEVANQRANTRPGGREYSGFGVDTSKVKTGGSEVVAQNIIAPQVDKTAEKVDLMKKRVEEIKKLSADFEDYASGRKSPPARDIDRPVSIPAADGKKSKNAKDNDYERLTKQITDRTAALVAETEAQRQLNPLLDDYGYAVEKARATQDLLNAAQKAGIAITPELRAQIEQLADQYAIASVEAAQLAESQDKARQAAEDMRSLGKDMLGGFISDLRAGKTGAKALENALGKVADKLIEIGLNSIFDPKSGGFGGIFGAIGKILGFDEGGYTGDGGKMQPKGVVHGGEYVFSKAAVQKAGVANLDAMHRNLKGFASGGYVGTPSLPRIQAPANQNNGRMHVTVGVDVDGNGNLLPFVKSVSQGEAQRSTAQLGRNVPKMVDSTNRDMRVRNRRP